MLVGGIVGPVGWLVSPSVGRSVIIAYKGRQNHTSMLLSDDPEDNLGESVR